MLLGNESTWHSAGCQRAAAGSDDDDRLFLPSLHRGVLRLALFGARKEASVNCEVHGSRRLEVVGSPAGREYRSSCTGGGVCPFDEKVVASAADTERASRTERVSHRCMGESRPALGDSPAGDVMPSVGVPAGRTKPWHARAQPSLVGCHSRAAPRSSTPRCDGSSVPVVRLAKVAPRGHLIT